MRLLWVEDENPLLEEGMLFLRDEGFTVVPAGTYAEAWEQLERSSFDLVLLDWLLPDRPGIELCKQIQQRWKIPVIMLTAKSDEFDKVLALEIGADGVKTVRHARTCGQNPRGDKENEQRFGNAGRVVR